MNAASLYLRRSSLLGMCVPFCLLTPRLSRVKCGRQPRDGENALDEWRAYEGDDEELYVYCPACFEREFGEDG